MMTYEAIRYDIDEGIATVTLNRPEKLNAWTRVMQLEVREAMNAAASDSAVRAIILTGAGRGFCAGADMTLLAGAGGGGPRISDTAQRAPAVPPHGSERADFQMLHSYFPSIPKPIVAAVNGPCAGLGFVITLYCDLRFASTSAVFTTAFAQRGLIAEHGAAWMLSRLIGLPNAADLLYSARRVDATEAQKIGLVQRTASDEQLLQFTREYLRDLVCRVSPRSVTVMKRQLWEGMFQTLAEATVIGEYEMARSLESEDFREGIAHFLERRPPRFTGY